MQDGVADDARKSVRKLLRVRATAVTAEGKVISGKTLDICTDGICIMLDEATRPGQICMITFNAFINGTAHTTSIQAKVVYATLNSAEGFRTGLAFLRLDPGLIHLIAALP